MEKHRISLITPDYIKLTSIKGKNNWTFWGSLQKSVYYIFKLWSGITFSGTQTAGKFASIYAKSFIFILFLVPEKYSASLAEKHLHNCGTLTRQKQILLTNIGKRQNLPNQKHVMLVLRVKYQHNKFWTMPQFCSCITQQSNLKSVYLIDTSLRIMN